MIVMIVLMFPLIEDILYHTNDKTSALAYIQQEQARGVSALLSLSALQVIIPFFPGFAIGVLAGLSYGVLWGLLIFLVGCAVGNLFMFVTVRQLRGVIKSRKNNKPKKRKFLTKEQLSRMKHPEFAVCFCFMMPGLPGASVAPYLFSDTKLTLAKYVLAAVAGTIPVAILYVFLGDHVSKGNYTVAIVLGVIFVIAVIIVLLNRKKLMSMILPPDNK